MAVTRLGIAIALLASTSLHATPLAYWRFEDHPINDKLDARMGTDETPLTFSHSEGGGPQLRTFNTRPEVFPPDTCPTFVAPRDLPSKILGQKNDRCARFFGNQDFYTARSKQGTASPLESASLSSFTIEGLFKLTLLAGENKNQFQVIVGKDGKPSASLLNQPFVVVVGGETDFRVTANCLSVHIVDRTGTYRTAASHTPLEKDHWYAFATTSDGKTMKLFINRFDGGGYKMEGDTPIDEGMIATTEQWTVGRGMYDAQPNSWLQGFADEIRIDNALLPPSKWLLAGIGQLPPTPPAPVVKPEPMPIKCVEAMADPVALLHEGVYYLYGTGDTKSFGVWTSRDLKTWEKGPTILAKGDGVWGDQDFWAPGIIEQDKKFYLYYSTSGILPYAGGPRTARINVAVSDSPTGPFKEVVARMPLIGRATIDPQPFIDDDGKPYLYFVGDVAEGSGQIYVAQLADDMLSIVGEPLRCIEHSQPWEGPTWNEGPFVFKDGDTYVLMYSGNFWASHDYAVGFATAKSPLGPWKKYEANPILSRYAGLLGTGHNCLVRAPDGGWLTFFAAHRDEKNNLRDTYFTQLNVSRDARNDVVLKPVPWVVKP